MRSSFHLMQVSRRQPPQGFNGCTGADEPWRGSLNDRILITVKRCAACQIARTHLHRCRTFVPAQMCTRRSRPSTLNPLTIKIGHIFLNRVSFDGARRASVQVGGRVAQPCRKGPLRTASQARRASVQVGGRVAQPCSVVRTRDRVCRRWLRLQRARPDLPTICRSFPKVASALSAKVCGG
jgi:hypothetical protein